MIKMLMTEIREFVTRCVTLNMGGSNEGGGTDNDAAP
jgi:hypothetical protein